MKNTNKQENKILTDRFRLSLLTSACVVLVFLGFAATELGIVYKDIFFQLSGMILPALMVMGTIAVIVCTLVLSKVPAKIYWYSVAVIIELFLMVYIILFINDVPGQFVEAQAEKKKIDMEMLEPSYVYQIGTPISFGETSTAEKYCTAGFTVGAESAWTSGNYGKMCFDLEGYRKNLMLAFDYDVYAPPQQVLIYANGEEIYRFIAAEAGKQLLEIPEDCIQSDKLILEFALLDAVSPASRGENDDIRLLALNMHNMQLYSKDEPEKGFEYSLGERISFDDATAVDRYCVSGFSYAPGNTWTKEHYAEMHFKINEKYKGLLLELHYGSVYAPPQQVNIYVNDNKVDSFTASKKSGSQMINIPGEYISGHELKLRFEFPDAVSPASQGENADIRLLSLKMESLQISGEGL